MKVQPLTTHLHPLRLCRGQERRCWSWKKRFLWRKLLTLSVPSFCLEGGEGHLALTSDLLSRRKSKVPPIEIWGGCVWEAGNFFFFKWKCISFHLMRKELQVRESGPGHVWQSLGRPRSLQLKKCGEALLWNTTIHGWMYISVSQQSCSYKIFSGRCFSRSYREERIGFRYVLGSEKTNGTCVNTGQ